MHCQRALSYTSLKKKKKKLKGGGGGGKNSSISNFVLLVQ